MEEEQKELFWVWVDTVEKPEDWSFSDYLEWLDKQEDGKDT